MVHILRLNFFFIFRFIQLLLLDDVTLKRLNSQNCAKGENEQKTHCSQINKKFQPKGSQKMENNLYLFDLTVYD